MNIQYHLTEEEARDGLNGLLPKRDRNVILMALFFAVISVGTFVNFVINGGPYYLLFAILFVVLSLWFFMNRPLKISFVSRRSSAADNAYLLLFSREGWVRPGKGDKVKRHGDDKARAVETALTVSIRPDDKHMYVIPKMALKGNRLEELCALLKDAGCPVKRMN